MNGFQGVQTRAQTNFTRNQGTPLLQVPHRLYTNDPENDYDGDDRASE